VVILGGCAVASDHHLRHGDLGVGRLSQSGGQRHGAEEMSSRRRSISCSSSRRHCSSRARPVADYSPGGSNALNYTTGQYIPTTGYSVTIGTVQYWNGTAFGWLRAPPVTATTRRTHYVDRQQSERQHCHDADRGRRDRCRASLNGDRDGGEVLRNGELRERPSVLLTITGTGFESGADGLLSLRLASDRDIGPMTTTFVSPTTLTVFADLTYATPGGYPIPVTNPALVTYPLQGGRHLSTSPLFTVLQLIRPVACT
jgi:hypothetical protein